MTVAVPSLSDRGWILSPAEKMDFLLSWFFETDGKQSYLYNGQTVSIQYLLAEYAGNIPKITTELTSALEAYFQAYFDSATVQITNNDGPTAGDQITLTLSASVTQNGQTYSLSDLIQSVNSRFQRVVNYNNSGILPTTF